MYSRRPSNFDAQVSLEGGVSHSLNHVTSPGAFYTDGFRVVGSSLSSAVDTDDEDDDGIDDDDDFVDDDEDLGDEDDEDLDDE